MIRRAAPRLVLASLIVAGLCVALGGCVTLFPKQAPAQLYRFGETLQVPPASGSSFAVRNAGVDFDRSASSDAILTVDGNQVAYITGARWSYPAPVMFEAAVRRGFASPGGVVRLIQPGEAGPAQYAMRLNVTHFEADYDHGATAAPTIVVTVRATLTRFSDQSLAGSESFEAKIPASDNRVGAITAAFDQAASQVIGQLVGWVDQVGAGGS
jgi:cholesterol transport system auxiliary component